jgi:hypothetical protein
MAAKDQIVCHVCGFKNAADAPRCTSCGARLEAVSAEYSTEEEAARRNQQTGFEVKWVVVAFAIYFVFQTIALAMLPRVIASYDPQGFPGLMISVAVWFVGGIVVGWISPGRTFIEPAVGALIAVVPTIAYLMWVTPGDPGERGFEPSILAYTIGGLLGTMISLFGAFIGEKIQGLTRGHRAKA